MEAYSPGQYFCDECGDEEAATVDFLENSNDRTLWICAACLRAALALLEPPQPVPQIEQPPARADGQQHGDDGEGV